MEKLSMCRVCLGKDIRLVPIVGTHLEEMYESLVLLPFETKDGRPILVCYICRARLKNCYELRKSCLQSEELFTQMLSCNESEQVKPAGIYNEKMVEVLGMDSNSVGVEIVKCEVKDEPNDGEDISENVQKENGVSDDVLPADSDIKNEESMDHELETDADSDGAATLVLLCDVKDEQSDPGDVNEDVLEERRVSDCVLSADSHHDFVTTVKIEQIGHRTSDSAPKEPTQDVQRSSEDTIPSNLNEHKLVQDTFKKLLDVSAAEIIDDNKEITASVQYTCDACQQCYNSKRELERHVSLCFDVCKKDLSRENTRSCHTHAAQKPHQCNVCNKRFSRIHHLTRHMFAHTDEYLILIPYQCHVCKEQFSQSHNLIRHIRTHSSNSICKKELLIKSNLNSHIRTYTGERPYRCDICKKRFSLKGNLTKHKRKHTGETPYHCYICKKQFSVKDSLTKHISTHTGEKPHHCYICQKQFTQKSSLTKHMRIHTGEKPYHCYICKKRFSVTDSLTKHMRTHTGEKPHQCYICKKQFSWKSHLTSHMRTHTGEKPHHCYICQKQFTQKSSLTKHMRTHTGEKPHHYM